MHLSQTRFVKIDGTHISAAVNTALEAKTAVKEIRQKKKEYAHIKKGLLRQKKIAERAENASRRKTAPKQGFLSRVRSTFSKVAGIAGANAPPATLMDLATLEVECARTEEILHNLDTVRIQIEGKLLQMSR
ncbi:MAG: hypothetical protein ABL907_18540 [Hyphomicrobium sp.]